MMGSFMLKKKIKIIALLMLIACVSLVASACNFLKVVDKSEFDKKNDSVHTHNLRDITYTWAEDNSTCTAEGYCIYDGHHEIETAKSSRVITKEATFDEEGEAQYSVSFTSSLFKTQTKKITLPKSYYVTIEYYSNKDEKELVNSEQVISGTLYTPEFIYDVDGYTFENWLNKDDSAYVPCELYEDIKLYPKFNKNLYEIRLDDEGGYIEKPNYHGKTIYVYYETEYELPVAQKRHNTFLGWYLGEEKIPEKGIWSIASDVKLTAKWKSNSIGIAKIVQNPATADTLAIPSGYKEFKSSYLIPLDGTVTSADGLWNRDNSVLVMNSSATWRKSRTAELSLYNPSYVNLRNDINGNDAKQFYAYTYLIKDNNFEVNVPGNGYLCLYISAIPQNGGYYSFLINGVEYEVPHSDSNQVIVVQICFEVEKGTYLIESNTSNNRIRLYGGEVHCAINE